MRIAIRLIIEWNLPNNISTPSMFPAICSLPALWAPVGLRYHATHHLFMSMPYHNLGRPNDVWLMA